MYTQDFYITRPVWNNAFSYHERKNKKLFVPTIKKIESFDDIKLLNLNTKNITFEDFDFDGKLQTCFGLKNLYELSFSSLQPSSQFFSCQEREQIQKSIPIYIVDNHNHVFYFWYLARERGIISDGALLYHVDEHADMRDPQEYLMKPDSQDLEKVFEYTNFFLNVGNFIIPAMKEWLIGEVVQIRSEGALNAYLESGLQRVRTRWESIILNLDLDFFEPELDYIEFELKKQVILDIAAKADLITICTSPFFIEQERAIRVLKEIFQ